MALPTCTSGIPSIVDFAIVLSMFMLFVKFFVIVFWLIHFQSVWFMLFNATFINIASISWWAVLLMEETGVHGENYQPVVSH
jgi:hypothetical protein